MNVLDNSVMIKGSNSGITVFLDSEMAFEDLLESVSEKFKSASKFFNNANMAISFDGRGRAGRVSRRTVPQGCGGVRTPRRSAGRPAFLCHGIPVAAVRGGAGGNVAGIPHAARRHLHLGVRLH